MPTSSQSVSVSLYSVLISSVNSDVISNAKIYVTVHFKLDIVLPGEWTTKLEMVVMPAENLH